MYALWNCSTVSSAFAMQLVMHSLSFCDTTGESKFV